MNELRAYARTLEEELNDCADLAEVDRVLASLYREDIAAFLEMARVRQVLRRRSRGRFVSARQLLEECGGLIPRGIGSRHARKALKR